jgi:Tol biopolymer transport system component
VVQLTGGPGRNFEPSWSPDGQRIAFTSDRDGNSEIYVMDADGANPTRLTINAARDYAPTWSPDGTKLAFASTRTGAGDIYSMNADGSGEIRLTNWDLEETTPSWSPDGTRIAFSSWGPEGEESFDENIYVMDAGGGNPVILTTYTSGPNRDPD